MNDDLASRYAPMIEQIAGLCDDDPIVGAQLRSLRVTREAWDDNRGGGHFWFGISAPAADRDFEVNAEVDDADGARIAIILHSVAGVLNWAEWFRLPTQLLPSQPVLRWPSASVRSNPDISTVVWHDKA